ncbi:MAG: hypothetical protein ACK5AC_10550 [Planctomycetota bacterium]
MQPSPKLFGPFVIALLLGYGMACSRGITERLFEANPAERESEAPPASIADEDTDVRWAVIGNRDAVERGLVDLIAVALDAQGFSMVDRSEVKELEKELERSVSEGTLGPALKLGRRLGAHRLVVCQYRTEDTPIDRIVKPEPFWNPANPPASVPPAPPSKPSLKIIVCDVGVLARIGVADFEDAISKDVVDHAVSYLTSKTLRDSANIQQVVGIPPFACKNFGDEFAELGRQVHEQISSQILAVPGVALLEWDAARELNREMESRESVEARRIPSIMEVDYRVIPPAGQTAGQVEVSRRVRTEGQSVDEQTTLRLSEFEPWLRSRILPELTRRKPSDALDREQQLTILENRARELQTLGLPLQTAKVREVILQIHPEDTQERLRLMDDYRLVIQPHVENMKFKFNKQFPLPSFVEQARTYEREHFEYLVRNNQISYPDAMERFKNLVISMQLFYSGSYYSNSPKRMLSMMATSELERALAILDDEYQFVRSVAPAILKLRKVGERSEEEDFKLKHTWTGTVMSVAILPVCFHDGSEESRQAALRLIVDVIPEDFPTVWMGKAIFGLDSFFSGNVSIRDPRRSPDDPQAVQIFEVGISPDKVLEFHAKHVGVSHRHVQLYMKLCQFQFRYCRPSGPLGPNFSGEVQDEGWKPNAELEAELKLLRESARQIPGAALRSIFDPVTLRSDKDVLDGNYAISQSFYDYVFDQSTKYAWTIKNRSEGKTPKYPVRPEPEAEFGRLRFVATNLKMPTELDRGEERHTLEKRTLRWQPDGPDHDLVYDEKTVYRLNRSGDFKLISKPMQFYSRAYDFIDEAYIWLFEKQGQNGWQISIRDREGQLVATDSSINLPPHEWLHAYGVGRGRGILVGWSKDGTWLGEIKFQNQEFTFRVFHEARDYFNPNTKNDFESVARNTRIRFEPRQWKGHAIGKNSKGEMLLLERGRFPFPGGKYGMRGLYPLRINLENLEVNPMPIDFHSFHGQTLIIENKLFSNDHRTVTEHNLDSTEIPIPSTLVIGGDNMQQLQLGNSFAGNDEGTLIHDGDWIVFPGQTWYRYNHRTKQTERLVPTSLPRNYASGAVGKSTFYGIVNWTNFYGGNPKVYQVEILP